MESQMATDSVPILWIYVSQIVTLKEKDPHKVNSLPLPPQELQGLPSVLQPYEQLLAAEHNEDDENYDNSDEEYDKIWHCANADQCKWMPIVLHGLPPQMYQQSWRSTSGMYYPRGLV